MLIRAAVGHDWLRSYPFFSIIVAAGRTDAFPEAFDHPEYGLVGLHVMFQRLGAASAAGASAVPAGRV